MLLNLLKCKTLNIILLVFIVAIAAFEVKSQDTSYYYDYHPPIKLPFKLAGTFGELRPNHFHTGIDIKTEGTEGYRLYAIEDGYISRIKISRSGYGNALYINHPNGMTSVYAHMQKFEPELQDFVTNLQYELRKFEIDYSPEAPIFEYKKGEIIGLSGNSGSSTGPHLHFEIRETASEHPLNPLKYGFSCKDIIAPRVRNLRFYGIQDEVFKPLNQFYDLKKEGSNAYYLSDDIIYLDENEIALAIQTYDYQSNYVHKNGVYNISLFIDDTLYFSNTFNELDFGKIRYINAYLDYTLKKKKNATYNRVHKLPGNNLDFYDVNLSDGRITLTEEAKEIVIEISDANENKATIYFKVAKKESREIETIDEKKCYNLIQVNENFNVTNDSLHLYIPEGSLYQNECLKIVKNTKPKKGVHSPVYKICDASIPSHNYFQISIIPDTIALANSEKAVICYIDSKNTLQSCDTYYNGKHFTGYAREFGEFYLVIDTIGPLIKADNFKHDARIDRNKTLFFYCKDAITDIKTYNCFVNDNWTVMGYNSRRNHLFLKDKRHFIKGKNKIEILVTDELDNLVEKVFYVDYGN